MEPKDIMQLQVEQYFEAAFSEDYPELNIILADSFSFIGPRVSDTTDREGLIREWKNFHKAF